LKEQLNGLNEENKRMQSRFSQQFISKIENALLSISNLQYEMEVIKINAALYALKKDLDNVEVKLGEYCLNKQFK
jgi:hypothetical protein